MRFTLDIGGVLINIEIPEQYNDIFPISLYEGFLREKDSEVDGRLTIKNFPNPSGLKGFHPARENLSADERRYPILQYASARQHSGNDLAKVSRDLLMIFRRKTNTMEVYMFEKPGIIDSFQSHIMFFLTVLLCAGGGMLLHGSGFTISGSAGAVIGPTGVGKTTAARLVESDSLLSEDIVAVSDVDHAPVLHATPLGGATSGKVSAPLRAIFFPRKAKSFSIEPISPRIALERYLSEHAEYISVLFKPHISMNFNNAHNLFKKVPSYELSFPKNYIDTKEIFRVM